MTADGTGQAEVVAFLADPRAYGSATGQVEHVQTHISHVFLVGSFVYKLKKAVRFAFVDFASRAARELACREEIRLNRRLAPAVYLDVVPVVRGAQGLRLGGAGDVVEWVVRMRRLPAARCLAALAGAGELGRDVVAEVGRHVAAFHRAVPAVTGGDPETLMATWQDNVDGARCFVGSLLPVEAWDVLDDFGRTFVVRHDSVLRARPALGHVRDGHGDLRLDHVYVLDRALPAVGDAPAVPAGIQIVDCVEFAPAFRGVDVAADLAFLAMELEGVDRAELARVLVEAYAEAAGDPLVPALVPYYACHRATVRGKVEALTAGDALVAEASRASARVRARAAFTLAGRFAWRSGEGVVVACTGLSGSGKSVVAAELARRTGWRSVSSDVVRRRVTDGARDDPYAPRAREAVYAAIRQEVEDALGRRESILVDATFLARAERDRLSRDVAAYGARHVFVECVADEAVVRRRLDERDASSVSDARWPVYVAQREGRDLLGPDEPTIRVETTGPLEMALGSLVPPLWAWRQGRSPVRASD